MLLDSELKCRSPSSKKFSPPPPPDRESSNSALSTLRDSQIAWSTPLSTVRAVREREVY
ncbi:predicted protein [Botrytis cinerea T4]|uniref:Uncharacterized protein n=1 Tax=Botryotinia fuckeliana (strain T4) TaxID=999810 RepID=G2YJK0_BOTF4|nr:predicted protein [Botrytis cinerea T4]